MSETNSEFTNAIPILTNMLFTFPMLFNVTFLSYDNSTSIKVYHFIFKHSSNVISHSINTVFDGVVVGVSTSFFGSD